MKDIELLHLLETNARLSTRDLSDILLEEEEQIQQRMESLEKRKIICGYHTVINWDKASRNRQVMAIIEVGVTPQRDYGYDKIARPSHAIRKWIRCICSAERANSCAWSMEEHVRRCELRRRQDCLHRIGEVDGHALCPETI